MTRYLIAVVAAGVVAGLAPGGDLKSGPEPGRPVIPFHPLNVTGPSAGEKACPV